MRPLGLAALSGLAGALAFPDPGLWPLSFIAWAPLVHALRETTPARGACLGMTAGLVFYLVLLRWLAALTVGGLLALALYLSLFSALFGAAGAVLLRDRRAWIAVPAAWAGLEWIRGWLFTGFGWGAAGYALAPAPWLIGAAALGGVPLLSFAVLAANVAVAAAWQEWSSGARRRAVAALAVALLVPSGLVALGALAASPDHERALRIAVVGGAIDPREKWSSSGPLASAEHFVGETDAIAAQRPDLIVWPETAIPIPIVDERLAILGPFLRERVGMWGAPLLVGAPVLADEPSQTYYNAALLFAGEGSPAPYFKRHLVPFGEYVPRRRPLSWFPRVVPGHHWIPGPAQPPFEVAGARVGVLICFEDVFPDEVAVRARDVDVLVVLTNDAWLPDAGKGQHLQMSVLRAVESGRAVARATNGGVSALIDPEGRIVRADRDGREAIVGELPLATTRTLHARAPAALPALLLAGAIAALLLPAISGRWRRRRRGTPRTGSAGTRGEARTRSRSPAGSRGRRGR